MDCDDNKSIGDAFVCLFTKPEYVAHPFFAWLTNLVERCSVVGTWLNNFLTLPVPIHPSLYVIHVFFSAAAGARRMCAAIVYAFHPVLINHP